MDGTRKRAAFWQRPMVKRGLKIAQLLLTVAVLSVLVDYWRAPVAPVQAAFTAFQTEKQPAPVSLAQLSRERTLVLYFWGSWCGICRHTSPVIQRLHEDGMPVLGVALRSGSRQEVRDYLQQHHWTFDTLNDEHGDWSQAWQVKVTPTIVLVRQGKVIHSTTGLASYWGLKLRVALADA